MFLKKGGYQEGGMKKEREADTPFCSMTFQLSTKCYYQDNLQSPSHLLRKNMSHKTMLNNKGPKFAPWETPHKIFSQFIQVVAFCLLDNYTYCIKP